ncbi:MAG: caspase family protein [Almyronema sp.]
MTQHWAVVVGINQYQALQPLLYAQQDAIGLWRFLTEGANVAADRCFLLCDLAEARSPVAARPDRQTLISCVQKLCHEQLQPDDVLWFFFSGYGIRFGDRDYLLPIDADPAHLAETACSVQALFELFKQAPTNNVVILLDINRAQAALADQAVGQQSLALARDFGLSLIVSCQPQEFSHETLAVKHGLFTAALLEGLQYRGCVTLDHIAKHLQKQLPELCEHHWRPTQHPAIQIPSEQQFLLMVPTAANLPVTPAAPTTANHPVRSPQLPVMSPLPPTPAANAPATAGDRSAASAFSPSLATLQRSLGSWGPLALIVALLLLLLSRFNLLPLPAPQPVPAPAEPESPTSETADPEAATAVSDTAADVPGNALFAGALSGARRELPRSALAQAQQAIAQQRYAEAIRWLEQVPAATRDETYNILQAQAEASLAQQVADNQARLTTAQRSAQPNQAASLAAAIAEVSQIPAGEPFYQEAQQLVEQWSQDLLNLADTSANQGDLAAAIATAQLVPAAASALHRQAQAQIENWQQRQTSQAQLQQAEAILQPGQAASFQDAIVLLRQVPAAHPEYDQAQTRIDQLSQEILSIARARAAQGRFEAAIQAAILVPPDTAAYSSAQTQLKRWQAQ